MFGNPFESRANKLANAVIAVACVTCCVALVWVVMYATDSLAAAEAKPQYCFSDVKLTDGYWEYEIEYKDLDSNAHYLYFTPNEDGWMSVSTTFGEYSQAGVYSEFKVCDYTISISSGTCHINFGDIQIITQEFYLERLQK